MWADKKAAGVRSDECLRLARLQSAAVDFAKSGIPADFPAELRAHEYPHFMGKKDKPEYHSERVIGQLYDHATEACRERSGGGGGVGGGGRGGGGGKNRRAGAGGAGPPGRSFDEDLRVEGWEAYRADAVMMRRERTDTRTAPLTRGHPLRC